MVAYYPRSALRKHIVRFYSFLRRTPMVSPEDKDKVEEVLHMQYGYDWLIETLPEVIEIKAKSKIEGKIEGELLGLRKMIAKVVETRFPTLLPMTQRRIEGVENAAPLEQLLLDIVVAPDKETVRYLLLSDLEGE